MVGIRTFEKDLCPYFEWNSDDDKLNNFDKMLSETAKDDWDKAHEGQSLWSVAIKNFKNKCIDNLGGTFTEH